MTLTRRELIIGASAAGFTLSAPHVARAASVTRHFDAYRGRARFGGQAIAVSTRGKDVLVDLHTKLKGRVLVFNFDYEVRSQEVWRNGVLQSITAKAKENNKRFSVDATRTADGLRVNSSKFNGVVTGDLSTSSIFMAELAERPKWISTQSGRIFKVATTDKGRSNVETPEGTVSCNHVYCGGALKLPVDAYFSDEGELVSYEFDAVGARARVVARSVTPSFHQLWG